MGPSYVEESLGAALMRQRHPNPHRRNIKAYAVLERLDGGTARIVAPIQT